MCLCVAVSIECFGYMLLVVPVVVVAYICTAVRRCQNAAASSPIGLPHDSLVVAVAHAHTHNCRAVSARSSLAVPILARTCLNKFTQPTTTSHTHARFLPTYVATLTSTLTSRKKTGNCSASSMSFALPLPLQLLKLSCSLSRSHSLSLLGTHSLILRLCCS